MKIILIIVFVLLDGCANQTHSPPRILMSGPVPKIFAVKKIEPKPEIIQKEKEEKKENAIIKKEEKKQENIVYLVKKGDTLTKISRKHKTTISGIMTKNPAIKNPNLIHPGQKILIGFECNNEKILAKNDISGKEKIEIIKTAASVHNIPWQVLAGLARQESSLGKHLHGDNGKSIGPFQINLPSHPEVSYEKAMDFQFSAFWSARYLVELGVKDDLFKALRLWNGSLENPMTYKHAKKVLKHAVNEFGLEI